jgi:bacterioferritin
MDNLNKEQTINVLNKIYQYELVGVVRYTHYALMITGRDRISLTTFFKDQANESLAHSLQAGDILTGIGGHPSLEIPKIEETNKHDTVNLLNESAVHEQNAIILYKELLSVVEGSSVYLEEYAREMIKTEEIHGMEIYKMLKDFKQ